MTDKIRALELAPPVSPEIVGFLRDLLTRAEAGEFAFVSTVAITHDHSVVSGWVMPHGHFFHIVGAMHAQVHDFIEKERP
jgi:hypothetical protein